MVQGANNLSRAWDEVKQRLVVNGASPSKKELNLGILGTANIAHKNTLAAIHSVGVRVYAIASRSSQRAEDFARKYSIPKAYGSYEMLLQDKHVDLVYIPLPTSLHKEWVIRAAESKKSILCEKPCFMNSNDLVEVISECFKHKVAFMDGVMFMHHVRYIKLLELAEDDPPTHVTSNFSFRGSNEFFKNDIRTKSDLDGLGCLGGVFGWRLPKYASGQMICSRNDVPIEFSGTLIWDTEVDDEIGVPKMATTSFHCSFLNMKNQLTLVSNKSKTMRINDFVIPKSAEESYWFDDASEEDASDLKPPHQMFGFCCQEQNMWEDFAILVNTASRREKFDAVLARNKSYDPSMYRWVVEHQSLFHSSAKSEGARKVVDPDGLFNKFLDSMHASK